MQTTNCQWFTLVGRAPALLQLCIRVQSTTSAVVVHFVCSSVWKHAVSRFAHMSAGLVFGTNRRLLLPCHAESVVWRDSGRQQLAQQCREHGCIGVYGFAITSNAPSLSPTNRQQGYNDAPNEHAAVGVEARCKRQCTSNCGNVFVALKRVELLAMSRQHVAAPHDAVNCRWTTAIVCPRASANASPWWLAK